MFISRPRKNLISVLDVGSSRTICLIAKAKSDVNFDVIGVGHKQSEGIKCGYISNPASVVKSVLAAVDDAEKIAGERIDQVYLCVSGLNISSFYSTERINLGNHEITFRDIKSLVSRCLEGFKSNHSELSVIDIIAIQYTLDGAIGIEDPRGMYGSVLSCTYHLITVNKAAFNNFMHCINKCDLEVGGYVPVSCAVGASALSNDEKNLGVTLLDVGGSCSTVSVFHRGRMVYNSVVPIGGFHITKDIACALSTTISCAEKIKDLYGSVVYNSATAEEIIDIPSVIGADEEDCIQQDRTVTRENLAQIIIPRVEEIFEMIYDTLKEEESVNPQWYRRIVVTGGSSKLLGIKDIVESVFSAKARIGHILYDKTFDILDVKDTSVVSTFGSVLCALDHFSLNDSNAYDPNSGVLNKFMHWIKEKVDLQ